MSLVSRSTLGPFTIVPGAIYLSLWEEMDGVGVPGLGDLRAPLSTECPLCQSSELRTCGPGPSLEEKPTSSLPAALPPTPFLFPSSPLPTQPL